MVETKQISASTEGNGQILDITDKVASCVGAGQASSGIVTVFVPGSTGALTTVEYEPGLVRDLDELWERIAPAEVRYHHDDTWHDGNGHAHVRASLLGCSLTVPFVDKELTLGTWQQIVFVDFDTRPRSRHLVVQIIGE
jgi:secondary thiamine-phosphate synthase enzyme